MPDDLFTQAFTLPDTDGSGDNRDNLHKAAICCMKPDGR